MNTTAQDNCKSKVNNAMKGIVEDLRALWTAYTNPGTETSNEDGAIIGGDMDGASIYEYGLSFDYVAPGTFNGQRRGYFRYQISYGGPSEEFRFFCDENMTPVRIEFWYLDWFDGAKKVLAGDNLALLTKLWDWFKEGGTVEAESNKAMSDSE